MRVGGGLVALGLLAGPWAVGQEVFERITTDDGLPGRQVLALCEDVKGFMWIGTDEGLARHEGVRIRTWHHDRKDPSSLSNEVIWDITQDEHGTLWVATDQGLCAYDASEGDFDRVLLRAAYNDPTSANRVHRVRSDGHGRIWLSTEDGLHCISTETRKEVPLPDGPAAERARKRNDHHSLAFDEQQQRMWIGVPDGALLWDARQGVFRDHPAADVPFACLADPSAQHAQPDGTGGVLWFSAGDRKLHMCDATGRAILEERMPIRDTIAVPQTLRCDDKGRIWCGTWGQELMVRDPTTGAWTHLEHHDDEPWTVIDRNVKSWCQDAAGRIWLGTYMGISILDPDQAGIAVHDAAGPDPKAAVSSIRVLDKSRLLIGSDGDGAFLLDRATGELRSAGRCHLTTGIDRPRRRNQIVTLAQASGGWYAGTMGGLLWLDTVLKEVRPLDRGGLPQDAVISFVEPADGGGHWVGTWHQGVFFLGASGDAHRVEAGPGRALPSQRVLCMASDGNDLWLGCNNGAGLLHLRKGALAEQLLNGPDSSGATYGVVRSLALADHGTLYIGTLMGGLGVRDPGSGGIEWFTRRDGLGGDRISDMLLDGHGGLWMITNRVLSRFDLANRSVQVVQPPATTRSRGALHAIALDADGSLLCAYGTLIVDLPTGSRAQRPGPPVRLTHWSGITEDGFVWPATGILELEHHERALSLEFGTPPTFSGQETRFAYRLVDVDTSWRSIGNSPRLELNDLPEGLRTLEVRASNGGSDWSAVPLSLRLSVHPAFWSTWWFRAFIVLFLCAAVIITARTYLRQRIRKERERSLREQAVLRERLRIADDMHDDLGTGLSALKLRGELALAMATDEQQRERLRAIADQSTELLGNMRQIIWAMGATDATIEEFAAHCIAESRRTLSEHGVLLEVDQPAPWPHVSLRAETRRDLFLVVKESVHNIVKHAGADVVTLRFDWSGGRLRVEITDNGRGIGANGSGSEGHGSRAMRRRAEAMKADLDVRSGPPGTTVSVSVSLTADGNIRHMADGEDATDLRTRGN